MNLIHLQKNILLRLHKNLGFQIELRDISLSKKNFIRYSSKQNPKRTMRNTKKRNEVNMEIKNAIRNDVQSKIDRNITKELFRYIKSMKVENSQVEVSTKVSADDFNIFFITACDQ